MQFYLKMIVISLLFFMNVWKTSSEEKYAN